MADTMLAVRQANSAVFLGEGGSVLVADETPSGPVVHINGKDIPLLNEEFRLSVVQPGSVKNDKFLSKHIGQIRLHLGEDAEGDEFYDEMYMVPIAVRGYSFAKFEKYDGKATTPTCMSTNGWFPTVKGDITPISRQCARYEIANGMVRSVILCPAASWGEDGEKPTCTQSIRVAFLTLPECIPVTMTLHGVGMSAFNALLRQLNKAKNVARIKKRDLTKFAVKLYTENMGTYVATKFSFIEAPEELGPIPEYTPVARHFRDTLFAVKATEKQAELEEEPDAEGDDSEAIDM